VYRTVTIPTADSVNTAVEVNNNSAGVYQLEDINPFFDLDIAHLAQGQYLVVLKGKRETELSARFVKID